MSDRSSLNLPLRPPAARENGIAAAVHLPWARGNHVLFLQPSMVAPRRIGTHPKSIYQTVAVEAQIGRRRRNRSILDSRARAPVISIGTLFLIREPHRGPAVELHLL